MAGVKHSKYQGCKIGFLTMTELRQDPLYRKVKHREATRGIRELTNAFETDTLTQPKEITPMTTASKYRVLKNSRVATKSTFASYEQARQWIRSKLRRTVTNAQARRAVMWDGISRNPPSIGSFGYAIKRVA
jgi:hypothetical protein